MFDPQSRYALLPVADYAVGPGRERTLVARRFLPQTPPSGDSQRVRVASGERLDGVAARTLGNPESWWRIADVAEVIDPTNLLEDGALVVIPGPGGSP